MSDVKSQDCRVRTLAHYMHAALQARYSCSQHFGFVVKAVLRVDK